MNSIKIDSPKFSAKIKALIEENKEFLENSGIICLKEDIKVPEFLSMVYNIKRFGGEYSPERFYYKWIARFIIENYPLDQHKGLTYCLIDKDYSLSISNLSSIEFHRAIVSVLYDISRYGTVIYRFSDRERENISDFDIVHIRKQVRKKMKTANIENYYDFSNREVSDTIKRNTEALELLGIKELPKDISPRKLNSVLELAYLYYKHFPTYCTIKYTNEELGNIIWKKIEKAITKGHSRYAAILFAINSMSFNVKVSKLDLLKYQEIYTDFAESKRGAFKKFILPER